MHASSLRMLTYRIEINFLTVGFVVVVFSEQVQTSSELSRMVCLLAVPSTLDCCDILNFFAAFHSTIQHIRIVHDGTPSQLMVLLE